MLCIKISSKGQIAIPKEIRERIRLKKDMKLEVKTEDDKILLLPVRDDWRNLEGMLKGTDVLKELEKEHRRETERDEDIIRRLGAPGMAKGRRKGIR